MLGICTYMKEKKISFELQYQIRQYLEFYLKNSKNSNNEQIQESMGFLSNDLKMKLQLEANKIVLKESPIFRNNFSQKLINKCVNIIEEHNLQVLSSGSVSIPPPTQP